VHLSLDVCDQLGEVWCVLLHCQCLVFEVQAMFVHARAWSTPPWAEAGGTWRAVID
jgi:hypothetical protein